MPILTTFEVGQLISGDGFGVSKFSRLVCDDDAAFSFITISQLIDLKHLPTCDKCGALLHLLPMPREKCRIRWWCARPCQTCVHVSVKTIFDGAKISYMKSLELILQWFLEVPVTSAAGQTEVSKETATAWYALCRQICDRATTTDDISIGRSGLTVEIDKSHKAHRKYYRGRVLASEHVCIFGGICRETREGFLQVVPDRKGETLWAIIQRRIHPVSVIMHDDVRVYRNLHLPARGWYAHHIINHSREFVDPNDPNIHTNTIERRWGLVKGKIKGFPGEAKLDMYLGEFLYRKHFLKGKTDRERRLRGLQFQVFLRDAAKVFPGFGRVGI